MAVARALQELGIGIPAGVSPNFVTMDGLSTTIQQTPGLPPLICGGEPPLRHSDTHPEGTSADGLPIAWRACVGDSWLYADSDGMDVTYPAVNMTGGAKALQETLPPPNENPRRVHVIGDSTLRVGKKSLVLSDTFGRVLKATRTETDLGA